MIEELYYLDEGQLKIHAASVGISQKRWKKIDEAEIPLRDYKNFMKVNRFDTLPIIANDRSVKEYFHTQQPNDFENIDRRTITYEDVLPLDTDILEVIRRFIYEQRRFYFLTWNSRVTGLITVGNLNCRAVQVCVFTIVCTMERSMTNYITAELEKEQIEHFVVENPTNHPFLKRAWKQFQKLQRVDLENSIIEQLFLINLFDIIRYYELHQTLGYSEQQWTEVATDVNYLRNVVAHSTKNLLDEKNSISDVWRMIKATEDLTFRLKRAENQGGS